MATFFKIMFNFAFGIVQALFGGLVLSKLWAWFITPKFSSAPHLNYLDCVGLMITVGFFLSGMTMAIASGTSKKDEDALSMGIVKSLVMILIVYPLTLLSAYVWHQFIQ